MMSRRALAIVSFCVAGCSTSSSSGGNAKPSDPPPEPTVEADASAPDASAPDAADAGGPTTDPALDAACTPTVVTSIEDQGPNGALFTDNVPDGTAFVQETGRRVCRILYRKAAEVRPANKITLILRADDKVAGWKSGDVGDITVMISTNHLASVKANGQDVKTEIEGVLTHEMTHMYQNDDKAPGEGTYPRLANVIEGIADAVRIRAKLPPTGSKPSKTGSWDDEGYWKPAYFLLWIDDQFSDFLYRLNQSMAIGDGKAWSASSIEDITGKSVDDLWASYAGAACCTAADRSCCQ